MIDVIVLTMPFLLEGLWMTFQISSITILCGSALGFVVGMLRTLGGWPISATLGIYIHALRGTPFLVHLYVIYFVLPSTGISWLQLEAFPAAVIALSLYTSTYVAEIVRGAIEAVPRGQGEAAGGRRPMPTASTRSPSRRPSGTGSVVCFQRHIRLLERTELMSITTSTARNSSHPDRPFNPGRRHRANFARAAVFSEFGRHAGALDQADFIDRRPWEMPIRSPEVRSK